MKIGSNPFSIGKATKAQEIVTCPGFHNQQTQGTEIYHGLKQI
jgi:hypothetical protein